MTLELAFVLIVSVPSFAFLLGVYVASSLKLRELMRSVRHFEEDTRDHRRKTPRVRMTLYNRFIERTRKTRRLPPPPVSEKEALDRKFVFLSLRPPRPPPSRQDTVLDLQPPFDELDDQVTLRMTRMQL